MQTRKLNTRSNQYSRGKYNRNALKSASNKKIKTNIFFKKGYKILLSFILVVMVYGSYHSISKVKSFNENTNPLISNLGVECKNFIQNKNVNSILNINFDKNKNLKEVIFIAYDKNREVRIDMTQAQFSIDKSLKQGTFQDFFKYNNIYLNQSSILNTLYSLFLKEFYLKVDHLIIGNDDFNFTSYVNSMEAGILTKIVSPTDKDSKKYTFSTDLCNASLYHLAQSLNLKGREVTNVNYNPKKKLVDYLNFDQIKKEQLRVQISNKSGVDQLGNFYQNLMENYGVNVVKVDNLSTSQNNTKIYVETSQHMNSILVDQVGNLLNVSDSNISVRNNLFSEVYIELGQDSIIN